MPVSVSAVSWAVDGASYITTKKSLTDHGLSFVAGQDCALFRVVTDKKVCQEYQDPFFSIIRMADASELIENQISQYQMDEIFYSFDLYVPAENVTILKRSRIVLDSKINIVQYNDQVYLNNNSHNFRNPL